MRGDQQVIHIEKTNWHLGDSLRTERETAGSTGSLCVRMEDKSIFRSQVLHERRKVKLYGFSDSLEQEKAAGAAGGLREVVEPRIFKSRAWVFQALLERPLFQGETLIP